jgi:hypothetical protein
MRPCTAQRAPMLCVRVGRGVAPFWCALCAPKSARMRPVVVVLYWVTWAAVRLVVWVGVWVFACSLAGVRGWSGTGVSSRVCSRALEVGVQTSMFKRGFQC